MVSFCGALTGCSGGRLALNRRSEATTAERGEAEVVECLQPLPASPNRVARIPDGHPGAPNGAESRLRRLPATDASLREPTSNSDPDVYLASLLADPPGAYSATSATDSILNLETLDLSRLPPIEERQETFVDELTKQASRIRADHTQFYSRSGLLSLGAGVGAGALMAHTPFDESVLHDLYAENIVLAPTHEFYERLHQPKILGDGRYSIPVFAAAAPTEPLLGDRLYAGATAEWGQRSLRTILVGGPPMLALQYLTGGSRPGESPHASKWDPGADNNGVSGHSFMGAIPFLSAAKMTDNAWLKVGWYAASAFPALSRINDDDHYPSQAFLGWWMAYLAASAVDRSQAEATDSRIHLRPQPDGIGVVIDY